MSSIPAFAQQLHGRSRLSDRLRRGVLFACLVVGLLVPTYFFGIASVSHFAWDFHAYYAAADAALAGKSFVGVSTGLPGVSYVYPPIAVVLFLPQTAIGGMQLAYAIQTCLNVITAVALSVLVVRTIEANGASLTSIDRLLIVGFCVGSAPVMAIYGQGQVDMLIALALAGAFLALERDRQALAGFALAGAALVKVFPVVLGLWLVWRRAWRAVATSVATGITGLAVGWAWFGLDAYWRYLDVLSGRSRIAEFGGTVSPNFFAMSLYRPFSQLFPTVDPSLYAVLAVCLVAPSIALGARGDRKFTDRLTTYLVAITAMLLASPASNALYVVYVYFPVLCLLFVDTSTQRQSLLLAGTLAIGVPVQPAQLAAVLSVAAVPAEISVAILSVAREVLTVISLPALGLSVVLVWSALQGIQRQEGSPVDIPPSRAD